LLAKSISVVLGERETIRVGLWSNRSEPTVAGKSGLAGPPVCVAEGVPLPQAASVVAARIAAATVLRAVLSVRLIRSSCRVEVCFADRGSGSTMGEALFLESAVRDHPAGDLAQPSDEEHHSCGTASESHRLRWEVVRPDGTA
jgi:hypothetical protein